MFKPTEREKKRPGTSQEKHVSVVGRKGISLGIPVVQQKEESVLSVQNMGSLLLVSKEINLHCKERNPAFAFAVMEEAPEEV